MSKYNLTFSTLRTANVLRLPQFKSSKGTPAHAKPDGSDWSLADWMTAIAGEVGEAANLIKKVRRGDLTLDEARPALTQELADVAIYLDLLAFQLGISLGDAIAAKFNEVSARVDADIFIRAPLRQVGAQDVLVEAVALERLDTESGCKMACLGQRPLGEPPHVNDPLVWTEAR